MATARLLFSMMLVIGGATGSDDFSWNNCRTDDTSLSAPLHIDEFSFSPDPIRADDYVYMSMKSEVTRNVTLPLTLTLTVKKIAFFGWEMPIPCLSTGGLPIGSCTYDVCSAMDHLEASYGCPSDFTAAGLPCHCPFTPGSYNTNTGQVRFYLDTEGLPFGAFMSSFLGGQYRTVVRVVDGDTNEVMCIEMRYQLIN